MTGRPGKFSPANPFACGPGQLNISTVLTNQQSNQPTSRVPRQTCKNVAPMSTNTSLQQSPLLHQPGNSVRFPYNPAENLR
ncbi:hypothetical protein C0J52_11523 [Blattella germanica]|nr:hypothetical protein C0J52_11523 [Blattella germanica]